MVRQWQQLFFDKRYSSTEMVNPNFVKDKIKFNPLRLLDSKNDNIKEIIKHDGPILVDIKVVPDENCYPMVAPGKSNAQMMGV